MSNMNDDQKLQLQKMIAVNNAVDYTDEIRQTKHSRLIKEDVYALLKAKQTYSRLAKTNTSEFEQICLNRANWLFMNYPDIYNRVYKDELDLRILNALLNKLADIEDGKVGQHEASVEVGQILKEMYVDSALKKAEKIEQAQQRKDKRNGESHAVKKPRNISYAQFAMKKHNIHNDM